MMPHPPAASCRRRLTHRLRLSARPAGWFALIALLGAGCTAVREPLAVIEPEYSYHDDAALVDTPTEGAASEDATLSRLYTVPIEDEGTVAAAGRLDVDVALD